MRILVALSVVPVLCACAQPPFRPPPRPTSRPTPRLRPHVRKSPACLKKKRLTGTRIWYHGFRIRRPIAWLSGDPADTQGGGAIYVGGMLLRVDKNHDHRFVSGGAAGGLIYEIGPCKRRTIVGVKIDVERNNNEELVLKNPLKKMTRQQIRALRGVVLSYWSKDSRKLLKHLDLRKTCLTVQPASDNGSTAVPHLPPTTCLEVESEGTMEKRHLKALSVQRSLRLLRMTTADGRGIPLRFLTSLKQFVHLPTGPEYTRIVGGSAGRSSPTFSTASAPLTTVQLLPGWSPCRWAVVAVSVAVGSHRLM